MIILGIETSCDETAAAIVEDGYYLHSNVVASSLSLHARYGGVVPEIAARNHIEVILPVIHEALDTANCTWEQIDAIAVTYGPGLEGSLLIGVLTARTLAIAHTKPLYAVNHVTAHVYANFITDSSLPGLSLPDKKPAWPLLAAIVSGGHTQLVLFYDHNDYQLLGQTLDDALGEAFDKVAKMLGLPYPGGPAIAQAAIKGDAAAFSLPKPRVGQFDFSFSGLKTAVLRQAQAEVGENYTFPSIKLPERLSVAQKSNIAASFQRTAVEIVVSKVKKAYEMYCPNSIVLAGGVAANRELRQQLQSILPSPLIYPDPLLCTDNAVMVASLGYFTAQTNQAPADPYLLGVVPNLSM
jgi:N6-L-threonylcarbamoyladenine synthase